MSENDDAARETQIARSWEANADSWTRAVQNKQIASRRLATDAAIVRAVLRHGVHTALDVGCGEGWLARSLSSQGVATVCGFDGSAPLIDAARRAAEDGNSAVEFAVCAYDRFIAAPNAVFPHTPRFDGIICNFALLGAEMIPLLAALRERRAENGKLFVQTVHPLVLCGDAAQPYADEWRMETFAGFGEAGDFPEPMPYYFRTVSSWIASICEAGWRVTACDEPLHPETLRPLSLLLIAE